MAFQEVTWQREMYDIDEQRYRDAFAAITAEWGTFFAGDQLKDIEQYTDVEDGFIAFDDSVRQYRQLLEDDVALQGIPRALARQLCDDARLEAYF